MNWSITEADEHKIIILVPSLRRCIMILSVNQRFSSTTVPVPMFIDGSFCAHNRLVVTVLQYEFNASPGTLVLKLSQIRRKCTIGYDTFAPLIFDSVPPLTSHFPKIMMAGGISPYHCLRTDDAPNKRIVITPTSGGMICALGLG
jgi:hypothetical protein